MSRLLLEDGSALLLEDGSNLLLEDGQSVVVFGSGIGVQTVTVRLNETATVSTIEED